MLTCEHGATHNNFPGARLRHSELVDLVWIWKFGGENTRIIGWTEKLKKRAVAIHFHTVANKNV